MLALLASMAAAWIAAGSTGLLAHPLRRVLTLVALGAALLAPGTGTWRPTFRVLLTPVLAALAGFLVTRSVVPVNILAAALVLAFLAVMSRARGRNSFPAAAEVQP